MLGVERVIGRRSGRPTALRKILTAFGLGLAMLLLSVDSIAAQAREFSAGETTASTVEVDSVTPDGIPENQREATLGAGWSSDGDVATVVLGGVEGLAVLSAESKTGYAWREVATLPAVSTEADLWISNSCVTSSGRYMAVVYAPRSVTNSEEAFGFGATAVIVDLSSGAVRTLGTGYSIAYFNPGCGADDTFTLTAQEPGEPGTLLAVVDAKTASAISKVKVDGQATSAISDAEGNIYAAASGEIIRVSPKGGTETFAKVQGVAYDLSVDDAGRLGYVTFDDKTAAAWIAKPGERAIPLRVATGPVGEIGIESARGGGFFLRGEGVTLEVRDDTIVPVPEASVLSSISSTGKLVVQAVKPAGIAAAPESAEAEVPAEALDARIDATATQTDKDVAFDLGAYQPLSSVGSLGAAEPVFGGGGSGSASAAAAGDPNDPIESERYCSVPRNDPNNQAYQPKPRQVEWAVDRAVKGQLLESRGSNWRNLGMAAYTPQGMFPPTALTGGGTIPPQVVLGVLMQESNMWQASRFTAPGSTGNPLIGNFYGNETNVWDIVWTQADCGYGVGQITDGMRIAAHPKPGETILPLAQQRAIALDYAANIAKAVQMLGQKWNQLKALGITINNGSASSIENWFAAVWAYNTGLQPSGPEFGNPTGCAPSPTCTTTYGTWGLGWANNPANTYYLVGRPPFLQNDAADHAATPQYWPYPEKVLGFAAWGLTLTETQRADATTRTYPTKVVSSYTLAWWNSDEFREEVKPPLFTFCTTAVNNCDSFNSCTITPTPFCYWHGNATWKSCSAGECGYGNERFSYPTYASESSSMLSSLPAETRQMSFPSNCAAGDPAPLVSGYSAPPPGALIVDDTPHAPVRSDCTQQSQQGSFQFTFVSPSGGSYPAKKDLHQIGGGYNAHFYFSHMRSADDPLENINDRLKITGTWTLNQQLHQWTRVWVHLPDHAGWTDQAGYHITDGNGVDQTRYLPQRRYANSWVSLGVFEMDGTPSISLSNILVNEYNEGFDDIAWDAVAFQPLAAKPADFVVGLGDSFSSGEGVGSYAAWSDHGGNSTNQRERNACHQSTNNWLALTAMPGDLVSIGGRVAAGDATLDYHHLACSGAESEQLLPYFSESNPANRPANAEGQQGNLTQYGTVSQLDAGYLDENTTLVTLSIGGNDLRFAPLLVKCIPNNFCLSGALAGDSEIIPAATVDRLTNELPDTLATVLQAIRDRAPNADIVLMGYPDLFAVSGACILIVEPTLRSWFSNVSASLADVMESAAIAADTATVRVTYADPWPHFEGHNLCQDPPGLNGLTPAFTPGDLAGGIVIEGVSPTSAQAVHPNFYGSTLYSDALEEALVDIGY